MRAVIQRVTEAAVTVHGTETRKIGRGLAVLVGVGPGDREEDGLWLAGKIVRLRIFADGAGLMNAAVKEVAGEILVVSQFTLFASTKKGNRPSFQEAAPPALAIPLYEAFVAALGKEMGSAPVTGEFGADMKVALVNDGPVTLWIDSKNRE